MNYLYAGKMKPFKRIMYAELRCKYLLFTRRKSIYKRGKTPHDVMMIN